MINQIGSDLTFDAFYQNSTGAGVTGLTVTVDIYRNATEIVTAGSATEVGDGLYTYTLPGASVTVAGNYRAVFKTSGTVQATHLPSLWVVTPWVANIDAAISSRSTLTAAQVWANATRTLTSFGTLIADIWGYVTRTLTAGGGSSAADVWAYATRTLTQTAAQVQAAMTGSALTVTNRVTFAATLSGLTIPADWEAVLLTVKSNPDTEADSQAALQILESNPGGAGDGLTYFNGSAAPLADQAKATLTVNQAGGTVAIAIAESLNLLPLVGQNLSYDVAVISPAGKTLLAGSAQFSVISTETRTI